MLSFSRGKDSIAAWLQLRRCGFSRIIPVHYYVHPDLAFVNDALAYYEDFFETKIYNMPSHIIYQMFNEQIFQPPERLEALAWMQFPEYGFDDIFNIVKLVEDVPLATYTGVGVTMFDNLARRANVKVQGPINAKRRQFYPIFDWTKTRIREEIEAAGVLLPPDYKMFGRSFDGMDYRFTSRLKEHYPEDFERLKEFYPLLEVDIMRMQFRQKHLERRAATAALAESM